MIFWYAGELILILCMEADLEELKKRNINLIKEDFRQSSTLGEECKKIRKKIFSWLEKKTPERFFQHFSKHMTHAMFLILPLNLSSCITPPPLAYREYRAGLSVARLSESSPVSENELTQQAQTRFHEIMKKIKKIPAFPNSNEKQVFFHEDEEIVVEGWNLGYFFITINDRNNHEFLEAFSCFKEIENIVIWRKPGQLIQFENNFPTSKTTDNCTVSYDSQGNQLHSSSIINGQCITKFFKHNGETLGTFLEERQKTPGLTSEHYLEMLTAELDTRERLVAFLQNFMQYHFDSVHQKRDCSHQQDHWQSAIETIERVENGKMLGDCEDYSFLAREILQRQGKLAHVLSLYEHAVCAWAEETGNNEYVVNMLTIGEHYQTSHQSTKQKNLRIALQEVITPMEQALETPDEFELGDNIYIVEIIDRNKVVFEVPIEVFIDPELYYRTMRESTRYAVSENK